MTKFAVGKALKLIVSGRVTFDESSVVHRVVPNPQSPIIDAGGQKDNYFTEMCSGSEEGSYSRPIEFCITQL